jgi:hypothetical protein
MPTTKLPERISQASGTLAAFSKNIGSESANYELTFLVLGGGGGGGLYHRLQM